MTFEELRQQVALFAAAMRKMGVKKGDRVVGKGLSLPPPSPFSLPSCPLFGKCYDGSVLRTQTQTKSKQTNNKMAQKVERLETWNKFSCV